MIDANNAEVSHCGHRLGALIQPNPAVYCGSVPCATDCKRSPNSASAEDTVHIQASSDEHWARPLPACVPTVRLQELVELGLPFFVIFVEADVTDMVTDAQALLMQLREK